VWERRGEYRRVEEKRGKVRKQTDVSLQVCLVFGLSAPSESVFYCKGNPNSLGGQVSLEIYSEEIQSKYISEGTYDIQHLPSQRKSKESALRNPG
jgi:hypothetical protein